MAYWTFTDPATASTVTFEHNPDSKKGKSGAVTFEKQIDDSFADEYGPMVVQRQHKQPTAEFTIVTLDETQYLLFWNWYLRHTELVLTDDLGRSSTIFITQLEAKRERAADVAWKHVVTVTYIVLSLVDI